ncbi:MAG: TolB family protein, partial [Pyrinomonadaceae bacterium]
MKRLTFALVALAAASSAAFCLVCAPRVAARRAGVRLLTREVALGRVHAGELKGTQTISPDRRHVAFVAKVEGGEVVYVDGVAGKTYPSIASDPLSEAGTGSPFTFSRDGRRVAYVAHLSNTPAARGPRRVVVDGVEGPSFDYVWSGALDFSEDGKHFTYTAERGAKLFAIVDGVEYGPYDRVSTPAFRDSKDRGFVFGFNATSGGRQLFVVNGKEFAADDMKGRELFFAEQAREPREVVRDGKHFVVWEGKEVGPFDEEIGTFLHTEPRAGGGQVVTFEGRRGEKQIAVIDGIIGKPYDYVGEIYVSPGGAHTLYAARRGDDDAFVVFDGKEGPKYSNAEIEGFDAKPFSPDGRHYAYIASRKVVGDDSEKFL